MRLHRRTLLGSGMAAFLSAPVLAQSRDEITLAIARDIQGALDPATRLSSLEANILRAVCPGLIAFRPGSFAWEPALARAIRQDSPTVISFELHPGRHFQDGFGEVTAEDVKFSFERFREPGPDGKPPSYAADWEALDHVEVTGPHAGRILLRTPAPMLWSTVLPDASGCIISRRAFAQGAYRTDRQPVRVIGAGPYTFAQWEPNRAVVLRADPSWPGPKPAFARITLRPMRDARTAELALRGDELQFAAIDPQNVATIGRVARTRVMKQDGINMVWLGLNVERPPLDDPRVRQAIRAAIDVPSVVEGGWGGAASVAHAPIAPGLLGHWEAAPRRGRDLAAARRMLAEAGAQRLRLRLTLLNQPTYQNAGVVLQALLAEAGITIDLDVRDGGAFWSAGSGEAGKSLELVLQRFAGKADPAFNLQWFTAAQVGEWNWQRWRDPEFDRLVADAARTDDAAVRTKQYIAAQQRMDESAAFIWLTHEVHAFGYRDWLVPAVLPNGDDMSFDRFARA
ncbi:ABC transporter substrate-binding protein [Rhodovastum atsumiense]|uniref:ABC transporter substrate-binding protein n=1 Tax=Rhodovastum atsumiense TaxID=504468 RepID=A0A5M6J281_9PROT|nr:ABC transporter substrate-binding protein [Rhodovastum atsumiense]KAA5613708.1 ABC transporter substrate-binding protein [Rhodovastum atsumiense]CAH2599631.1 ABC transporter substrate-binding protein [Rhodovastum atsumiense]